MSLVVEESTYLEHYGVKGMRWGVRRDRRINTLRKAGSGKAKFNEKARAYTNKPLLSPIPLLGPIDLVAGRGFRGAARRKANRNALAYERIRTGESTVRDRLTQINNLKYQDVFPTSKAATNTSAAIGATIVGAILVGATQSAIKKAIEN